MFESPDLDIWSSRYSCLNISSENRESRREKDSSPSLQVWLEGPNCKILKVWRPIAGQCEWLFWTKGWVEKNAEIRELIADEIGRNLVGLEETKNRDRIQKWQKFYHTGLHGHFFSYLCLAFQQQTTSSFFYTLIHIFFPSLAEETRWHCLKQPHLELINMVQFICIFKNSTSATLSLLYNRFLLVFFFFEFSRPCIV